MAPAMVMNAAIRLVQRRKAHAAKAHFEITISPSSSVSVAVQTQVSSRQKMDS